MVYSYIVDNIFVGDIFSTNNKQLLMQLNCIISLVDNVYHHNNIDYLTLPIEDKCDKNILPLCEKAYEYIIKNNNKNILVHCMAGGSRSVSIILYYIMKKYKKTFEEAYNFMNTKHNNMNVNKGFISQLKSLDI